MRVIFMGTPDFAVPALRALVAAGHEVIAAYTQPPRPGGRRGRELTPTPVHRAAEELGIAVRHPASLKGAEEQAAFAALGADVAVVAAYGLILPQAVLDAPTHGCLNLHASLLPRWRGAAPIQRAILAGDAATGVQVMQMAAGLDTGAVRASREVAIEAKNAGQLTEELSEIGAGLIVAVLADLAAFPPVPQAAEGVTYAHKIDKAETRIDWGMGADTVLRQIRAFAPAPGAWCEIGGERCKLLAAEPATGQGTPGEVLDDHLTIACGHGAIRPTLLQRAGKPAMPAADLLRGWAVPPGTRLE
ncbi:MAG: methionyl-tRNA formyltransferase [Proteobacteria bacterium]|nr:methionyl-tRNA formyltransferase [Pseudomonadota bacterium]